MIPPFNAHWQGRPWTETMRMKATLFPLTESLYFGPFALRDFFLPCINFRFCLTERPTLLFLSSSPQAGRGRMGGGRSGCPSPLGEKWGQRLEDKGDKKGGGRGGCNDLGAT